MISHQFELESPNLHQTCIMGYAQLLILKIGVIDIDLQGHLAISMSEFQEKVFNIAFMYWGGGY